VTRILVVDDDPSVVRFLERGLRLEGYDVSSCASGEAAFLEARTQVPDLVILDWMLPGLQGDEVILRLHELFPELPIIVLSARDTTIDQERMIKTGADAVLVKPVDFRVLLGHVLRFTQAEGS
jgi:DNA-binding response OmpR family regulator